MIREKQFYRLFFGLTMSLALQNLLTFGVNLLDTVMLGRYSQAAMGGVSLCNQFQFLLQMLVSGAGEGAVVLGAQYWGRGDLKPIPHIIGAALRFGGGMAVGLFALALAVPETLLGLLSSDAAVVEQGVAYMRIICFTYVIFTLTNILVASLRSIGVVKIGYVISFSTLCINGILNYCLIYGNLGFPELGVRGAAIATLVSRCVAVYLKFFERRLHLRVRSLVRMDKSYLKDYAHISLPVLVNQALWGVAQMVQTGILGHLGGDVTAANAIAVQVYQVLSVVSYGAASAAAILVGKTVGSGQKEQLRQLVSTLERMFLLLGIAAGAAIWAVRGPVLALFGGTLTQQASQLAMSFMAVLAVTTVGTSYQMACDNGIIRGGGDTAFSAKMNLVSMWLILVPVAAAAAFWWNAPPTVVFFLLKWDQLYKILPVALRLHSWKWVRVVTRP